MVGYFEYKHQSPSLPPQQHSRFGYPCQPYDWSHPPPALLQVLHFESCPYSRWRDKFMHYASLQKKMSTIPFPFYVESIDICRQHGEPLRICVPSHSTHLGAQFNVALAECVYFLQGETKPGSAPSGGGGSGEAPTPPPVSDFFTLRCRKSRTAPPPLRYHRVLTPLPTNIQLPKSAGSTMPRTPTASRQCSISGCGSRMTPPRVGPRRGARGAACRHRPARSSTGEKRDVRAWSWGRHVVAQRAYTQQTQHTPQGRALRLWLSLCRLLSCCRCR